MAGTPPPIEVSMGARDTAAVLPPMCSGVATAWSLEAFRLAENVLRLVDEVQADGQTPISVNLELLWPVLRVKASADARAVQEYFDVSGWLLGVAQS